MADEDVTNPGSPIPDPSSGSRGSFGNSGFNSGFNSGSGSGSGGRSGSTGGGSPSSVPPGPGSTGGSSGARLASKPPSKERALIEGALKQMPPSKFNFTTKPPPLASDAIPGYDIVREIHRGGQGVVYQAVQKTTQQKVAIKVMHGGPFASVTERQRLEREVRILATLNHPNIVRVYDSGEVQGAFYYVMDYVSGHGLDTYIAAGPHPIERTLGLFTTICSAISAAHLKGVIHRDIKPSNIRVDADGVPHILDFGLAKLSAESAVGGRDPRAAMTMTGQFVGSLPWASPEQAGGIPDQVDIRTDVYSLGVILYQMLTGKFPYQVIGNMRDILDNILKAEPAKPSTVRRQINDEVETIVLKCLAKEKERRYQSAGELGRDVQRYLTGEPIEAKRDSGWYMISKTIRRHRVPFAAGAVVAGLTVVFGIAMAVMYSREAGLRRVADTERARAETALKAESEAKAAETVQRTRAEENASRVRSLALSFMLDFNENIANLRGATKAREGILRKAKETLATLAAESSNDPALLLELATAYDKVGDIEGGLYLPRVGDTIAAAKSYQAAREIREKLATQNPSDTKIAAALGESLRRAGFVAQRNRKLDEAQALYQQAADKLAAAGDSERALRARTDLADLTVVRASQARDPQTSPALIATALTTYREAEQYWRDKSAANPADAKAAQMLGWMIDKQAKASIALGQAMMASMRSVAEADKPGATQRMQQAQTAFSDAQKLAEKAAVEFEKLARENPANAVFVRDRALAVYNAGDALQRTAELMNEAITLGLSPGPKALVDPVYEASLQRFTESLTLFERLATADESNIEARHDLILPLNKIGNQLRGLNRLADAASVFHRSLALRRENLTSDATEQHLKDLAVGCYKRAEVHEKVAATVQGAERSRELAAAVRLYTEAVGLYQNLAEAKIDGIARDLAEANDALTRAKAAAGG